MTVQTYALADLAVTNYVAMGLDRSGPFLVGCHVGGV